MCQLQSPSKSYSFKYVGFQRTGGMHSKQYPIFADPLRWYARWTTY